MKKLETQHTLNKQELLFTFSGQYDNGGKKEKTEILDFATRQLGFRRDYAAKILRGFAKGRRPSWRLSLRGRKPIYCDMCVRHLEKLYVLVDRMGAEKMKAAMPLWLPHYVSKYGLSEPIATKLEQISARTIGRLLKPFRDRELSRKNSRTKPPSNFSYKTKIPVPHLGDEIKSPGYFQGDTVAHHGHSLLGPHHWSLTATDVATTWTENEIMPDRKGQSTLEAICAIQTRLPFRMLNWHSDCGMEFMNETVQAGLADANNYVVQTRGRPYKKNDQAYVEQKNFTHVRELLGYCRYDTPEELEIIQSIYRNEWRLLMNFFMPQRKMIQKHKIGSQYKRTYDKLQTPYQRVMASQQVSTIEKEKLKMTYLALNPLALRASLIQKLNKLRILNIKDEEKIPA